MHPRTPASIAPSHAIGMTKGTAMDAGSAVPSGAELVDEISKWTVGGGIITMALFPLALPILVLTVIAALPLLTAVLAAGLLIGAVALAVLLVRGAIRALGPHRTAEPGHAKTRPRSAGSALAAAPKGASIYGSPTSTSRSPRAPSSLGPSSTARSIPGPSGSGVIADPQGTVLTPEPADGT
jgi:hypothetical protein